MFSKLRSLAVPLGCLSQFKVRKRNLVKNKRWINIIYGGGISLGLSGIGLVSSPGSKIFNEAGGRIDGLKEYSEKDVNSHDRISTRVWVTYREGVYDVTDFIPLHPGADKLLLAAGGSIEPFWSILAVHKENQAIHDRLESYRIGNFKVAPSSGVEDNPYMFEPTRNKQLLTKNFSPFVGEPPLDVLCGEFITPTELFFVRNHLPVPEVDLSDYCMEVWGTDGEMKRLSLADLKQLPPHTITATLQGAANRRDELAEVLPLPFIKFSGGCSGNAVWKGARLRDVLSAAGFDVAKEDEMARHVIFEGLDTGPAGSHYSASIPIEKAVDQHGDVLLAYEMNGEPLSPDHGFPVRALVPGVVGARSVKWLGRIIVSSEECGSHWQALDYKGLSPSVMWGQQEFEKADAIQGMPVTSMICSAKLLEEGDTRRKVVVSGYAWSGAGKKIIRVDLTGDGGKTWTQADSLHQTEDRQPRHWGWTLWEGCVLVKLGEGDVEIWSKAVDSDYNVQPENTKNIWNLRGLLNNSYSKIKICFR